MTSNIPSEIDQAKFRMQGNRRRKEDSSQVNYETLLNFWNKNQVIHISGEATPEGIQQFVETLLTVNPKAKVNDESDLETVIKNLRGECYYQDEIRILDDKEQEVQLVNLLHDGMQFSDELNKMQPCLRFAILALLSENKFNIFNSGLIHFMSMLNNGGWSCHLSEASFGAFIIDHINTFKELDYKDDTG